MANADMVILNGKICTVDRNFSFQEAIAIKNGWIIDVGSNDEIKRFIGPATKVIKLAGEVVFPGAHDAHIHALDFGFQRPPFALDLRYPKIKSIQDMISAVAEKVQKLAPGKWIHGMGWNPELLDECKKDMKRLPRKSDFDAVSPQNPIAFYDFSHHSLLVNSKALEIAGITKDTPNPVGGIIERDQVTGEPIGIFHDAPAQLLVEKYITPWSEDDLRLALKMAQKDLNAKGFTSYSEAFALENGIKCYKSAFDNGDLMCRVSVGMGLGEMGKTAYDTILAGMSKIVVPKDDPMWLTFRTLKLFADGVPPAYTSAMWDNYIGTDHRGRLVVPGDTDEEQFEELVRIVKLAQKQGYNCSIHATGDRGAAWAIDACTKAMEEISGFASRHYIIHGEYIDYELAKKAAKYQIGLSVQPVIDSLVFELSESLFGEEKAKNLGALSLLWKSGINIAGGSDCPVTPASWLDGVQAAMMRKSAISGKVFGPEHSLGLEQAIKLYTINGAYQERMELVRGSIEIGKVADLQILSRDIFTTPVEEISEIPVAMTILGGKIVFEN